MAVISPFFTWYSLWKLAARIGLGLLKKMSVNFFFSLWVKFMDTNGNYLLYFTSYPTEGPIIVNHTLWRFCYLYYHLISHWHNLGYLPKKHKNFNLIFLRVVFLPFLYSRTNSNIKAQMCISSICAAEVCVLGATSKSGTFSGALR